MFSNSLKAFFGRLCIACTDFHLVEGPIEKGTEAFEVAVFEELLVFNEIFNLVPVVGLEGPVLQLLQVSLVELTVFLVACIRRFEQTLERAPLEAVPQLQVAHRLLLHAFEAQGLQSLAELD